MLQTELYELKAQAAKVACVFCEHGVPFKRRLGMHFIRKKESDPVGLFVECFASEIWAITREYSEETIKGDA